MTEPLQTSWKATSMMALAIDIHALLSRIERATGTRVDVVEPSWPWCRRAHYMLEIWLRCGFDRHPADEVRARGYIDLLTADDEGVRYALDLLLERVAAPGHERLGRRLADQLAPQVRAPLH